MEHILKGSLQHNNKKPIAWTAALIRADVKLAASKWSEHRDAACGQPVLSADEGCVYMQNGRQCMLIQLIRLF